MGQQQYEGRTRRNQKKTRLLRLKELQPVANDMNMFPGRCQCIESCPNPSLQGKAFCNEHMSFCPRRAPLSGSEPKYEPARWNPKQIRLTHNCFSYAFNIIDKKQIEDCKKNPKCFTAFHQPGSISGFPKFNDVDPKTCPNMISRLLGDNPDDIDPCPFEERCPSGTSKIALVVDQDQDYHFLRQDAPTEEELKVNPKNPIGYFSQKGGSLPVTNKDALGHEIFDVELANHNFAAKSKENTLNYDKLCGYFCVPRNKPIFIKVGGRRQKRYAVTRRKR